MDALEIPAPACRVVVEGEQTLFRKCIQKLDRKERVSGSLLLHQLRQWRGAFGLTMKSIRNQLSEVATSERLQGKLLHLSSGLADRIELAHQRMRGIDFVVAIGADQHQMLQLRPGQQILQQIERRRIEPLQIVEEQRQRMFRAGEARQ